MIDLGFGCLGLLECTAPGGALVFYGSTYGYRKAYDHLSVVHIHSIGSVVPIGYHDIAGYLPGKMDITTIAALDSDTTVVASNSEAHLATDIIQAVDNCEACVLSMRSVLSHLCLSYFHDVIANCEVQPC